MIRFSLFLASIVALVALSSNARANDSYFRLYECNSKNGKLISCEGEGFSGTTKVYLPSKRRFMVCYSQFGHIRSCDTLQSASNQPYLKDKKWSACKIQKGKAVSCSRTGFNGNFIVARPYYHKDQGTRFPLCSLFIPGYPAPYGEFDMVVKVEYRFAVLRIGDSKDTFEVPCSEGPKVW